MNFLWILLPRVSFIYTYVFYVVLVTQPQGIKSLTWSVALFSFFIFHTIVAFFLLRSELNLILFITFMCATRFFRFFFLTIYYFLIIFVFSSTILPCICYCYVVVLLTHNTEATTNKEKPTKQTYFVCCNKKIIVC